MKFENIYRVLLILTITVLSYAWSVRTQPTYTYWVKAQIEGMPFEVTYEKDKEMSIDELQEGLARNMNEGTINEYEIRKNGIVIRGRKIIPKMDLRIDENGYLIN